MKVGVLLSGCGVEDGSEVYEAVLTILALEKAGADVQALAPDVVQAEIYNHYTGHEERGDGRGANLQPTRNVLSESARIVRGEIISGTELSAHDLDALIIVGGYGVVKNLCTFNADGVNAKVNPEVKRLITEMNGLGKPIGAMCAGPILLALTLPGKNLKLTVGDNAESSLSLEKLGAQPVVTKVSEVYIDAENSIVSTAAFMEGKSVSEVEPGINLLVAEVLKMARALGAGHDNPRDTAYAPLNSGLGMSDD